jgi:hypothetical protein
MTQQLCGLDAAMARDDFVVVADQHRVGETKPLDAVGDLSDLLSGMGACVASIGFETGNGHSFDLHAVHGRYPFRCLGLRFAEELLRKSSGRALADEDVRPSAMPHKLGIV